jgi:hypothetical protein
MSNTPDIDRIGISKLETLFSQAGWKFREQPIKEYGVDAQVEIFNNDNPTGKLIAIQIKSGLSYFSEKNKNAIIFRPKERHVEYWLNHCLPVILILYNPDSDTFYWVKFEDSLVVKTRNGYKIKIPKNQILDIKSIAGLVNLFTVPLHERKLHSLILESQWMRLINDGIPVYAKCFDWINKSLSRTEISLWYFNGKDDVGIDIPTIYCPGLSSLDILQQTFPWAEFYVDDEIIDKHLEEQYELECYGHYDKEDDEVYYTESFSEWLEHYDIPSIVPYENHGNEATEYRFQLKLNDLGKAILIVLDNIYTQTHLDTYGFRI